MKTNCGRYHLLCPGIAMREDNDNGQMKPRFQHLNALLSQFHPLLLFSLSTPKICRAELSLRSGIYPRVATDEAFISSSKEPKECQRAPIYWVKIASRHRFAYKLLRALFLSTGMCDQYSTSTCLIHLHLFIIFSLHSSSFQCRSTCLYPARKAIVIFLHS